MDGGNEELQTELAEQLQEQINSLAEVELALALSAGHEDEDLLLLKGQLEEGIAQLHDSLRELQQHAQQQQQQQQPSSLTGIPAWMHQPGVACRFRYTDGQHYVGRIHSLQQEQQQQEQQQQENSVAVSFAFPTRAYMLHPVQLPAGVVLPAAEQQQQQSRATSSSSSNSGLSVGSRVLALAPGEALWQPAEVLQISQLTHSSKAAAAAAAADSSSSAESGSCRVVFVGSGQSFTLPLSAVTLSALAAVEHEEQDAAATAAAAAAAAASAAADDSDGSSSDMSMSGSSDGDDDGGAAEPLSDEEEADEEAAAGLGLGGGVLHHAQLAAAAGVAQDSASFAAWESHSRGIASRLLARMGFRRGSGLGKTGAGITVPLEISMLPAKKGLGAAPKHKTHTAHGKHGHSHSSGKQRSKGRNRGGERTRRRKAAAARHAAKGAAGDRQGRMEAATGSEGVFAFINFNLGTGSEAAGKLRDAGLTTQQQPQQTAGAAALASAAAAAGPAGGGGRHKQQQQQQQQQHRGKQQQPDRKNLIGSHDDLAAAKARVSHLKAMLSRNESNRGLAPQIKAKLAAAQRELDVAAAQHRQMRQAVTASEAANKWAKF